MRSGLLSGSSGVVERNFTHEHRYQEFCSLYGQGPSAFLPGCSGLELHAAVKAAPELSAARSLSARKSWIRTCIRRHGKQESIARDQAIAISLCDFHRVFDTGTYRRLALVHPTEDDCMCTSHFKRSRGRQINRDTLLRKGLDVVSFNRLVRSATVSQLFDLLLPRSTYSVAWARCPCCWATRLHQQEMSTAMAEPARAGLVTWKANCLGFIGS